MCLKKCRGRLKAWILPILLFCFVLSSSVGSAQIEKTDCIGPSTADRHLLYLHGLEKKAEFSTEERENRRILEALSKKHGIRIALPLADLCKHGKRCWQAQDKDETRRLLSALDQARKSCWPDKKNFALLGFSNGGYFALKAYKWHDDPFLKEIIAFGSAGQWDSKVDRPNPLSKLHLAIGLQDMTRPQAARLAKDLAKDLPGFGLKTFAGGHRLDASVLKAALYPGFP